MADEKTETPAAKAKDTRTIVFNNGVELVVDDSYHDLREAFKGTQLLAEVTVHDGGRRGVVVGQVAHFG